VEADYRPYPSAGGLIYLESPLRAKRRAEGTFEPYVIAAVQRFVEPGMTFVDAGAHMGDFSLLAAKVMGNQGRVIAFEPEPQNFGWLERSVELNGYSCVECFQVALSDTNGEGNLFIGKGIGKHTLVQTHPHEQETITVPVRTLDSVLNEIGQPSIDVMKIDVEGAELRLLHGAAGVLERNHPLKLFIDIHAGRQDPRTLCRLLTDQGFSLHVPSDPDRELEDVPVNLMKVFAFRD
jgi:FkbM family methyltransferase